MKIFTNKEDGQPTLAGNPGEGGLTAELDGLGRCVRVIGKRVPTSPEEDAQAMRDLWDGSKRTTPRQRRVKAKPEQSGLIFGMTWEQLNRKQQGL